MSELLYLSAADDKMWVMKLDFLAVGRSVCGSSEFRWLSLDITRFTVKALSLAVVLLVMLSGFFGNRRD